MRKQHVPAEAEMNAFTQKIVQNQAVPIIASDA
jgi:hypothetical protein